jgi:hypothetical protein
MCSKSNPKMNKYHKKKTKKKKTKKTKQNKTKQKKNYSAAGAITFSVPATSSVQRTPFLISVKRFQL